MANPFVKKYPFREAVRLTEEQRNFLLARFETVSEGMRALIDKAIQESSSSDTALPNEEEFDPWVPLSEAAKFIGVSASNLRKYCALGIWGEKIGRNWFMRKSQVFQAKKVFDDTELELDEKGRFIG